jgi:pilus assembly protein CpaE
MSDVYLATADRDWELRVRDAFAGSFAGEIGSWAFATHGPDLDAMVREIASLGVGVVVVGPDLDEGQALDLCARIDEAHPEVCVLLVAPPDADLFQRALRAGVRDVVDPEAPSAEIRSAIERARDTTERRRSNVAAATAAQPTPTKVIAVVSAKGGAGKTAISTNLGVGLAMQRPGRVVIIDLDVQFGDVGHALRLLPEHTLSDIIAQGGDPDTTVVKASLTNHPSGLYVLSAPETPAEAEDVRPEQIRRIIEILAQEFEFVIVDTPAGLDEITLTAMETATDLLLVCGTDVASIRSMRKEVDAFDQIGLTLQRRHFALNRADARVGLEIRDIEGTVGLEVDVQIPSSRTVPLSMNQGSPILESQPRSPVARAYGELVNRFLNAGPTPAEPVQSTAQNVARFRRRKELR